MVTAAAGSDAAVVLVDITKLDLGQATSSCCRRPAATACWRNCCACPTSCSPSTRSTRSDNPGPGFAKVKAALEAFAGTAGLNVVAIIRSARCAATTSQPLASDWWQGESLLQVLERLPTLQERTDARSACPCRCRTTPAIRAPAPATSTALWGRIAHGAVKAGDTIELLPSRQTAVVAEVRVAGDVASSAQAGTSAGLVLTASST